MTVTNVRGLTASIAFLAALGSAGTTLAADGEPTVFTNARILTMGEAGVIDRGCVAVAGDEITQVASGDACDADGATVHDIGGRTLMPGLADMHTHYAGGNAGLAYIANGVTTVRVPWGTLENARGNARAAAGTFVGPYAYYSGPLIDGEDPIWGAGAVSATSPQMIEGVIEAQRASGYRAVKLYAKLDAETYRAGVAAAKARDLQVWTHVPGSLSLTDVLELGVDSIEHLDAYDVELVRDGFEPPENGRRSVARWAEMDPAKIERLVALTKAQGVWNCVTFGVLIDMFLNAENAEEFLAGPDAIFVEEGLKGWWGSRRERLADDAPMVRRGIENRYAFVRALHEAGAGLLIGTDAPNPYVPYGTAIHRELAHFHKAGIGREDVLRIATVEAARFLGEEEVFGQIAAGMRADLVIVDGDPLSDFAVFRDPYGVMAQGHWFDRADLAARTDATINGD